MPTRRALMLALPAGVVLLAVAVWLLWIQPSSTITRENAAKIKEGTTLAEEGMTLAEVEAILGGPARDETTGPVIREEPPEFAPPDATSGRRFRIGIVDLRQHLEWHSDHVRVWVHLDPDGRVADCTHFPTRRAEESPLDMLRRCLRL